MDLEDLFKRRFIEIEKVLINLRRDLASDIEENRHFIDIQIHIDCKVDEIKRLLAGDLDAELDHKLRPGT